MTSRIQLLQSAIFISSISSGSRLQIASAIGTDLEVFDGIDPVMIPLPENAPPVIPQIVMTNDDLGWQFQYSPSRSDLTWNLPNSIHIDELPAKLNEISSLSIRLWTILQSRFDAKSRRLGFVANFILETKHASSRIWSTYFKEPFGEGSSAAQIHYLHKFDYADFKVNRWIRLSSQPPDQDGNESILLLIDVNTITEEPLSKVDNTTLEEFIGIAGSLIEDSLRVHTGVV